MKIAAIIPVKTFSLAKTRLSLSPKQKEEICEIMLEEILYTLSISPQIFKTIIVTKEKRAIEIGRKYNVIIIIDNDEKNVNCAIALADKYLLENKFDASIVFPRKGKKHTILSPVQWALPLVPDGTGHPDFDH
mgnify:CR=1 FL=1